MFDGSGIVVVIALLAVLQVLLTNSYAALLLCPYASLATLDLPVTEFYVIDQSEKQSATLSTARRTASAEERRAQDVTLTPSKQRIKTVSLAFACVLNPNHVAELHRMRVCQRYVE